MQREDRLSREKTLVVQALLFFVFLLMALSACAPGTGILSGGNWQTSGLQHQHIQVLEAKPGNPERLYAGSAQGNVFISTDAGQHWREQSVGLPFPNAIHALSFDNSGKKLYAATDKGLFTSTDTALLWSPIPAPSGLPHDSYTTLTFDVNAPSTMYAGSSHQGIFVSRDGGTSWTSVSSNLPKGVTINDLAFDSDHQQLWAATSSGVYRSDGKGDSWQALNTGLPADILTNVIEPAAISGGAQGLIYLGTNQGFFRSPDSGAHWTRSQEALAGTSIHRILVDFRSTNATTLYVACDAGVFRSTDSGQFWGGVATGLPRNEPVYALSLGADNYTQLYAASNDVYQFPGTSTGFTPSRLLPVVLIVAFFYLLYRLVYRQRNNQRHLLKPEHSVEKTSSTPEN